MTSDLTFNTIAFKKSFDTKEGSERRSTTRGVNTPDLLVIKHQDATQSSSKLPMKRHLFRVDRQDIDATDAKVFVTSAYAVVEIPERTTQAELDNVVATFKAVVADATFISAVVNSES
jgi:hypothetical protein